MEAPGSGSLQGRLVLPLSLVLSVVAAGTLGYRWLWRDIGGTWLDALFMTVTTITTIGYGEVKPLDGPGRIFTIAVAVTGIGGFFYTFTVVMEHLVAARLADPRGRRRMERRIAELERHVIVAGLGRVGRQAAAELGEAGTPFVVLDPSPVATRVAEDRGYLLLAGDATEDAVLERAGVRRARGLIATTANDATNMYIVLSARVLNPALRRSGHQPLRHRRASPGPSHPESGRRGLLRNGAQAGPGSAGDRGRLAAPRERRDRPDTRGPSGAAGDRRLRARGAPGGHAPPQSPA
jgi:voltage-gated potassium channel Kch